MVQVVALDAGLARNSAPTGVSLPVPVMVTACESLEGEIGSRRKGWPSLSDVFYGLTARGYRLF